MKALSLAHTTAEEAYGAGRTCQSDQWPCVPVFSPKEKQVVSDGN